MAEIAAGAVVAEQVVSTAVQGGIAAYALTTPTMPLHATFTQMVASTEGKVPNLLQRSNNTINIIGSKLYLFGGQTAPGTLAGNDMHVLALPSSSSVSSSSLARDEYTCIAAEPAENGGSVPESRAGHSACVWRGQILIFGGYDSSESPIGEDNRLWAFDIESHRWTAYAAPHGPKPSSRHSAVMRGDSLIVHLAPAEVWSLDLGKLLWTALPSLPDATPSTTHSNLVITGDTIHIITGETNTGSSIHHLSLKSTADTKPPSWQTTPFPTNPLTPGPRPRTGAALVPLATGQGRHYLLYLFGSRSVSTGEEPEYWSDMWTYQLPSTSYAPANLKDTIREKLGFETGGNTWAEVEVKPRDEETMTEGKIHPGPRAWFGCDVANDGRTVVLWGGINPRGEREGDGWVVKLE
ncbi:hypothetical protein BJ546DRAFT_415164 [Cryomyces antarcticus]